MLLSKDDIDELKNIHWHCTGQDLTDDHVAEMGTRLLRLARLLVEIAAAETVGPTPEIGSKGNGDQNA